VERQTPKKAAARKVVVTKTAVRTAVARATKASAKLEHREVPAG
jgi:hypothetical protein